MEEWSRESLFTLAENIEQYPCLWRKTDPAYKKRNRRQQALHCIAQNMNCSMEKIDRKLKIIITQFYREVKKENALTASERGYKSKWFLYPALEYLKESKSRSVDCSENEDSVNAVIVSIDDANVQNDKESSHYYENFANSEDISVLDNDIREEERLDYMENDAVSDTFQRTSFRKRPSNHKKLIYVARNFSQSAECRDQDECDIFGSFVAKKMKKLNEINRSVVQMEITQILFNKEMEQRGMMVETAPTKQITLNSSESSPSVR